MAAAMGFSFAQVETHKAVQSDESIQQTKASIVLPTYNEKDTICPLIGQLIGLKNSFSMEAEPHAQPISSLVISGAIWPVSTP
jgi:hypothetical protein